MKRISVLIPDADIWWGLMVARCLARCDWIEVHGLARRAAPSMRHSHLFASFEDHAGAVGPDFWLHRAGAIVAERNVDVVLPTGDETIRELSARRGALSWGRKLSDLPSADSFDTATDKAQLAEFLVRHDLPRPPTVLVTSGRPTPESLSKLKFPVLAKPPRECGGDGIGWFANVDQLVRFVATRPAGELWVVETVCPGWDLTINALCRNGDIVAVTTQRVIEASHKKFGPATGVEFCDYPPALELAERLLGELNWSGIASIDMRFDTDLGKPLILEVNGRYWNSRLGPLNAGVNFPLLACEIVLGEPEANRAQHRARYFYDRRSIFVSLIGGGKYRIRPKETNLRYVAADPIHTVFRLGRLAAKAIHRRRG